MSLKTVKGNFQRLFDKNLTDLVRGLRNNKDNEVNEVSSILLTTIRGYFIFTNHVSKRIHISTFLIFSLHRIQANYIATCIDEIKQELRIDNINVKCNAVAKLTYVSQVSVER